MTNPNRHPWQLPDGIDELLPGAASQVESLRRELLDCAARWGYQLVIPPMLEFTDSLLVGSGEDLDLLTFKAADPLTGRMLGVRADMTPQVARMDAHSMRSSAVNRLCYAGSTLHTRSRSLAASRSPLQLGAELYGDSSSWADLEVIDLMLCMLDAAGVDVSVELTLDIGHGDVFAHVLAASGAPEVGIEEDIFDALQRKSRPDLEALCERLPAEGAEMVLALLGMQGDLSTLDRAHACFAARVPAVGEVITQLRDLGTALQNKYPALSLYVDLAELRGYRYHTGVVFAVYAQGLGEALARGGRYDNVGSAYGRARSATGFATDLRLLAQLLSPAALADNAIAAPSVEDADLEAAIFALRQSGETVIRALSGVADARCSRQLVQDQQGAWVCRAIDE